MNKKASKELFFEGTIHAVANVGMENLRTKMVADSAGFSEAAMFRYFSSKDDLLCQTFLEVDRRVSNVFMDLFRKTNLKTESFIDATHRIWKQIYRYLIEHGNETLYLIRFRYSALYTDEIRSMRQAYGGSFEHIYVILEERFGSAINTYREFLVNYIFELTLCFAEKILTGRVKDSEVVENRLWAAITGAIGNLLSGEAQL